MITTPTAEELDRADPLGRFRRHFAGDEDGVLAYLDGNSLGRPVITVPEGLAEFVTGPWGVRLIRAWDEAWMDEPSRVGDRLGEVVLGAASGQVIVADSTSVLIYKLVRAAADADPERTEIIIDRQNFPTDRFILQGIAAERGLTIRWIDVDPAAGVREQDLDPALGDRTAVVVLSHVAYRSGFLADAPADHRPGARAGALMMWDLSHSVGSVPIPSTPGMSTWPSVARTSTSTAGRAPPRSAMCAAICRTACSSRSGAGWARVIPFEMGPDYAPADRHPAVRHRYAADHGHATDEDHARVDRRGRDGGDSREIGRPHRAGHRVDRRARLAPLGVGLASPRDPARPRLPRHDHPPGVPQVTELLWTGGVIPDFRAPDGIRIGLSPLSTSFAELDRGMEAIETTLAESARLKGRSPTHADRA